MPLVYKRKVDVNAVRLRVRVPCNWVEIAAALRGRAGAVACLGSGSVGRGHGAKRCLSRHAPPVVAGWRSCLPGPCLVLRRLESVRMCRVFRSLGGRVGTHGRQSILARGHDGPDVRWQAGFASSADALWSVGGVRLRGYRVPRTPAGGGGRTCNRGRPLQAFSSALAASGTMHANGAALYARKSGQHTGNTACVIPLMGPHALVRNADWASYVRRPPPSVHPTLLKVRRGGDRIVGKAASVHAYCLYTASACSDRRHLCIKSAFGAGVIFLLPVS